MAVELAGELARRHRCTDWGTRSALCLKSGRHHGELQMFIKRISWSVSSFLSVIWVSQVLQPSGVTLSLNSHWILLASRSGNSFESLVQAHVYGFLLQLFAVFFFFSECFHCSRPFEVTFCHFFTSSLGCCSSPKPFCFMHPYDQLRLAPGPVFFILWPDLTAALEACGAMDSDAIKMSSGRPARKRSAGRKWQFSGAW